jgi:hypothetical protein
MLYIMSENAWTARCGSIFGTILEAWRERGGARMDPDDTVEFAVVCLRVPFLIRLERVGKR